MFCQFVIHATYVVRISESAQGIYNHILFFLCHAIIHRNGQYRLSQMLCNREISLLMPQIPVCLCQMRRNRIMNNGTDFLLIQILN